MSCIFSMQDILTWTELDLHLLVACFLRVRFPIVVALNKADTAEATAHIVKVQVWPLAAGGLGWQGGDQPEKLHDQTWGFLKKPLLPATSKIGWTIWTCVFLFPNIFLHDSVFLDPSLLTFSCRVPAVCPQPGSSWKYGRRFCAQWTMASAAAAERLQGLRCWVVQGKRPMGSTRAWLKVADLQSVWKCVFKYW